MAPHREAQPPPGLSTRRISPMASSVVPQTPRKLVTTSKVASGHGIANVPDLTSPSGTRSRATAARRGEASIPATEPREVSGSSARPLPHATSSKWSPLSTPSACWTATYSRQLPGSLSARSRPPHDPALVDELPLWARSRRPRHLVHRPALPAAPFPECHETTEGRQIRPRPAAGPRPPGAGGDTRVGSDDVFEHRRAVLALLGHGEVEPALGARLGQHLLLGRHVVRLVLQGAAGRADAQEPRRRQLEW